MTTSAASPAGRTSPAGRISPQNAQRLALWLAHEQPQLFAAIHAKVVAMGAAGQLSGLGCNCGPRKNIGSFGQTGFTFPSGSTGITSWDSSIGQTALPGSTGATGITSWDSSIGATALPVSIGGTGYTGATGATPAGANLAPIGTTAAGAANAGALTAPISSTASGSTGFWSSFASDIGSVGSSVLPAVADVAGAIAAPSTLAAVAGAVSAYYASEPTSTAAQIAAAQLTRTEAGESPAAISGSTLYTSTGNQLPVTSSLLSGLTPSEQSMLIPLLLIGAITLVLMA